MEFDEVTRDVTRWCTTPSSVQSATCPHRSSPSSPRSTHQIRPQLFLRNTAQQHSLSYISLCNTSLCFLLAGISLLAWVPLLAGVFLLAGALCWRKHGGVHFRVSSTKFQWYQQMSWVVQELSGVLRWRSLDCGQLWVCDARSDVTWRESSSIRSRIPAVLSGVEGEMLFVVGRGVISQILSAKREAESRLPSVWQVLLVRVVVASWPRWCEEYHLGRLAPGPWGAGETAIASGRPFPHVSMPYFFPVTSAQGLRL